jgi:hypothetical protein
MTEPDDTQRCGHHGNCAKYGAFLATLYVGVGLLTVRQRQMATPVQIASTTPNGHAPCKKP